MSSSSIDHGGAAQFADVHPDIIQSHILNRLDGPTLAAASCASSQFRSLCNDDCLWKNICNYTWPSTADGRVASAVSAFPSGHRSFFSDAFPSLRRHSQSAEAHRRRSNLPDAEELISAVDISYGGEVIYSKVLVTETTSSWFLCTPLRLDLMDPKETVAAPAGNEGGGDFAAEQLRVSWILIDPAGRRAANVAGERAVATRHWLTGDARLRFSVVAAASGWEMVECAVVVSCRGGEDGEVRVREVSMQVEDVGGRVLMGMDGVRILTAAMAEERVKRDGEREREVYEMFVRMKEACRERKERRENQMDMVCIATGIFIFFSFLFYFSFHYFKL